MRILRFACALSICVVAAMLGGCGGVQPAVGASDAAGIARSAGRDAQVGDLLYTGTYPDYYTYVYTYPGRSLAGMLTFNGAIGDLCSNTSGDVFIPTTYGIYEFQHDASTPISVISNAAYGCSVDPTSGDLATNLDSTIAIYTPAAKHHWSLPRLFTLDALVTYSCAYDAGGDLFVDGETSHTHKPFVALLPKGASEFEKLVLNETISDPGTMQWDGQYLAIGDQNNTVIHRFAISGATGTQVGTVTLKDAASVLQFWIQGGAIVGTAYTTNAHYIGFWQYPAGGSPQKHISVKYLANGITISVEP